MQVSKKRSNNTSHRVFDLYHNIHHHNTIPAAYRDHHLLFLKVQSDTHIRQILGCPIISAPDDLFSKREPAHNFLIA